MHSEELRKNGLKALVVVTVLLASLVIVRLSYQPLFPEHDSPTYNLTVWIEPMNITFHLSIDFFLRSSDVGIVEQRSGGITFRIDVNHDSCFDAVLYSLPAGLEMVWVDVYVDENAKTTSSLDISQKKTVAIPGHIVEILLTPWTDE